MSKPNGNPLIRIEVTLTPHNGKPSGYEFRYASDSGLVAPDGSINLEHFDKKDVDLLFVLVPVNGVQPAFPRATDDAVWFAEWPKGEPPPAPCPDSPGHANSSFSGFKLLDSYSLQFTDKNKDNRRYAYALRCLIEPVSQPIADDPIIINKYR